MSADVWVYKNTRTGHVVEYTERSVRLDHLPVWLLIASPAGSTEPVEADESGVEPDPDAGAGLVTMPRPSPSSPKSAWIAYAMRRGMPRKDAAVLSKAALIEEFGGEGDDDGED
ncbi:hypothetical protein [Nonomuraea basaltis]|uniref:hypothetical protein n=1 Tax=Nonomuraea basaltis TaxID=2495887 RepID=UPI00110C6F71|nr:hypothetical protein [Nonomuraea basaltis]TMR97540.1 hypothetical protein EJK15_17625 [Nonomuraea basaltis]